MDEKKLWLKISGSITYYFKCYNSKLSNEEIWLDYVEYALPDMEERSSMKLYSSYLDILHGEILKHH